MTIIYTLTLMIIFFLVSLVRGIKKIKIQEHKTKFSLIIACKNEEQQLQTLFNSINSIDYHQKYWEVIFIDDHSSDQTFLKLTEFCKSKAKYHAYRLDGIGSGKKYALQFGIDHALYEWIALTDADCLLPPDWLSMANNYVHNQVSMLIGYSPEIYVNSWQYFKQLVNAINYAASTYAGIPVSCHGRNLFFSKHTFFAVGGYSGLMHFPAGDDKLLMQKFIKHHAQIAYIPYPKVVTFPPEKMQRKNQNLRRYGKFPSSSIAWKLGMILFGLLFLFLPLELLISKNITHFIFYSLVIELYLINGCLLHKERIRPLYLVYAMIFPYYLFYQMTSSLYQKWSWK